MEQDDLFMERAIELAIGPAFTSPNPRVGAVVVRGAEVISEGFHAGPGTTHAEAATLKDVDPRGATLYVNLEPCVHEGRTPPCAPVVIASGVARVVIATEDPFPEVRGRGIEMLRAAGIEVEVGVLAAAAERLNAPFLNLHRTGRPLVTLKLALSLDGKMSASDGSSRWITGEEARQLVHRRRQEADAVLVGAGTVLADDPSLNVRLVNAARHPLRIVVDSRGRVPASARLFSLPGETVIATTDAAPHQVQLGWKEAGAEVVVLPAGPGGVALPPLLDMLGERGLLEVYCEGGPTLAGSLVSAGLVDRLELHYGPVLLGGGGLSLGDVGVTAINDAHRWSPLESQTFGDTVVLQLERCTR